jgi:NADH pyrophosphatase NudC (nudix superfamily)
MVTIRLKNSIHQSCRFCPSGGSVYKAEDGGDVFYICQAHKDEHYPAEPVDPTPEPEPAKLV